MIHSKIRDYELTITPDFSPMMNLLSDEKAFFVIDQNVYRLYPQLFSRVDNDRLFLLDATESEKTIETALEICEKMIQLHAKRNARLISFGGGITQDVTGFAANVLYRGIHWTFVPTTLLAACDSCIGGKTSLNYKGYKNLLGTFFPPEQIFVCSKFFHTLSEADFQSGLGEVVKFNFLMGEEGVKNIEANIDAMIQRDTETTNRFVESSLLYKKNYIEADEFDNGVRVYLNFAHTFGHAIETVSKYEIPHGTAVAMGMIAANRVSVSRGIMSEQFALRMENTLYKIIPASALRVSLKPEQLLGAIKNDKKQINDGVTAVLMDETSQLSLVHDVQTQEIFEAYSYITKAR